MDYNLKYYSKSTKIIYCILTFILIIVGGVFLFLYKQHTEKTSYMYIFISNYLFLVLFNLFLVTQIILQKRKIREIIGVLIKNKEYDNAKKMLISFSKKKKFKSANQMALYFYGFNELLLDNVDESMNALSKIDLDSDNSNYEFYLLSLFYRQLRNCYYEDNDNYEIVNTLFMKNEEKYRRELCKRYAGYTPIFEFLDNVKLFLGKDEKAKDILDRLNKIELISRIPLLSLLNEKVCRN